MRSGKFRSTASEIILLSLIVKSGTGGEMVIKVSPGAIENVAFVIVKVAFRILGSMDYSPDTARRSCTLDMIGRPTEWAASLSYSHQPDQPWEE